VRCVFVVLVAACAGAPPGLADSPEALAGASRAPADAERHFAIWLGGARVGTAHEIERWSPAGVALRRSELLRFQRGDAPVTIATTIDITADGRLVPSRVTWTEQAHAVRRAEAVRDPTGWLVTHDGGVHRLPHDAVPAELTPLLVRRDGQFSGPAFLPARGFVAGAGRIAPVAPRRLVARLVLDGARAGATGGSAQLGQMHGDHGATAEATIDLGDDAMPMRVVDGEGVIATRITAVHAAAPFTPVDVIAATAIPLRGTRSSRLALEGVLAVPQVPGQAVHREASGVVLALSPRLGGTLPAGRPGPDRTREIAALLARVRARIKPDLAAAPASLHTASAATAGDCTTFALAYAALAASRAIPTLVVTGFRVDGDRLVRHRWAASWTGRAWIAVDAAFGAVPAGGDLVGLAVHDTSDVGLLAGEAALTQLRAASWK
jgi:hypothetical protein